jgi:dephospho-CoA kinase
MITIIQGEIGTGKTFYGRILAEATHVSVEEVDTVEAFRELFLRPGGAPAVIVAHYNLRLNVNDIPIEPKFRPIIYWVTTSRSTPAC